MDKLLKRLSKQNKLTEKLIIDEFKKQGEVVYVTKRISSLPGYEIVLGRKKFFLLENSLKYHNMKTHTSTKMQSRLLKLAIPIPLNIGMGVFDKAMFEIKKSSNPQEEVNKWLMKNFSIEEVAVYFEKYFKNSHALNQYLTIIFESIEAFYGGLDHVAIISLLPVLEAGLRNIQNNILRINKRTINIKDFSKSLKEIIMQHGRSLVSQYDWYPGKGGYSNEELDFFIHLNPQCDVINSFCVYLQEVLYKKDYLGETDFNRNNILHLFELNFKEPTNFFRIILALTHITFIESLSNNSIPFLWPGIDETDRNIANYIRQFSLKLDQRRRVLKELDICKYE